MTARAFASPRPILYRMWFPAPNGYKRAPARAKALQKPASSPRLAVGGGASLGSDRAARPRRTRRPPRGARAPARRSATPRSGLPAELPSPRARFRRTARRPHAPARCRRRRRPVRAGRAAPGAAGVDERSAGRSRARSTPALTSGAPRCSRARKACLPAGGTARPGRTRGRRGRGRRRAELLAGAEREAGGLGAAVGPPLLEVQTEVAQLVGADGRDVGAELVRHRGAAELPELGVAGGRQPEDVERGRGAVPVVEARAGAQT